MILRKSQHVVWCYYDCIFKYSPLFIDCSSNTAAWQLERHTVVPGKQLNIQCLLVQSVGNQGPGRVGSQSSRSLLNTLLYKHPLNDWIPTWSLYTTQLAIYWLASPSHPPCVHALMGCTFCELWFIFSFLFLFSCAFSLSGWFSWICSECVSILQSALMLICHFLLLLFPFKSWISAWRQGSNGWNGNWNVTNCKA